MKTLFICLFLSLTTLLSAQRIKDRGNFILFANGTGDTITILKSDITIRQVGIIVDLQVKSLQSPISLMYDDFGFSNSTQLRQWLETIIYNKWVNDPSFFFYSYSQADTLHFNASDSIAGISIVVPPSATDSVLVSGKNIIIDGKSSGFARVSPGNSLGLGYNDLMPLDSISVIIRAHSMPNIITTHQK